MLREGKGILEGSYSQEVVFPDSLKMSFTGLSIRVLVATSVENSIGFVKKSEKLKPVDSGERNC